MIRAFIFICRLAPRRARIGSWTAWVFCVCSTLLPLLLAFRTPAAAQQSRPEEYQVKAVYLYNFGRFATWPAVPSESGSFDICVIGHDPFGPALDATLSGESIENKKLVARRISTPAGAAGCRILFVSSSEAARVKEILGSVSKTGVLTVSDMPGFTANGGMIQFVMRENKVRFEVNLSASEKAGLTLSSQLLKVATDVRKTAMN